MDLQIYGSKHRRGQTNCHKKGITRSEVDDMVIYVKMKQTKKELK